MKPAGTVTIILLLELMLIDKRKEILSCGQLRTTLLPRILNSYETHHWPWHVAIYHQYNETYSVYKCGGTLISSNAILTAAHCVSIEQKFVSVSLGRLNLDASESSSPLIKVGEIFPHPNYVADNNENDIAIIKLATNATFNNYVQPICLWPPDKIDIGEVTGKSGTVVGWGLTEKDTGVCTGDSGGSMSFQENGIYRIRGIVSVGPSGMNQETQTIECDPTKYAVFTDVAQYLPWIGDVAKVFGSYEVSIPPGIGVEFPPGSGGDFRSQGVFIPPGSGVEFPPGSGGDFRSQGVFIPPGS